MCLSCVVLLLSGCAPTLKEAVERGNVADVQRAVENNANVNETYDHNQTPLLIAVADCNPEVVKFLISSGADVSRNEDALGVAAFSTKSYAKNSSKCIEVAQLLIDHGQNVNTPGKSGFTPLMSASINSDVEMMAYLIEKGADVNARFSTVLEKESTVLSSLSGLVQEETLPMFDLLLANGADPNLLSPLTIAVKKDSDPVVYEKAEKLVAAGADVNRQDEDGNTPLMILAKNADAFANSLVDKLIAAGADINRQDKDGNTPLMILAGKADAFANSLAKKLVAAGADINIRNSRKESAWCIAMIHRNTELANQLVSKGYETASEDAEIVAQGINLETAETIVEFANDLRDLQNSISDGTLVK